MNGAEHVFLRICATCPSAAAQGFETLRDAIAGAALPLPVEVVPQSCMNGCSRPVSMALQGDGMATYFFADIDTDADCDDIIGTLRVYMDSPKGWIEDARPCGRLRTCLIGRVPALPGP